MFFPFSLALLSHSMYLEIALDHTIKSSVPKIAPTPLQMPITNHKSPELLIDINQMFPYLLLGSINLLERLTEFRKTVYVHLSVYYRKIWYKIQMNIQMEINGARYMGRGRASRPSPGMHSFSIYWCSTTWKHSEPHIIGIFFIEASSHRHAWSLTPFSAFSPFKKMGMGQKIPSF